MKEKHPTNFEAAEVSHDSYDPSLTTTVSLRGTLDWVLAICSMVLIFCSGLMIANGTCSKYHKTSVYSAVCVGGHLSVPAWLAIVGVEFSLLGTVVIPRTASVLISKYLTTRLIQDGLPLSTLLNLHPSAPVRTQLQRGMKKVVFIRVLVVVLAGIGSILYKFSFARTNMQGRINIPPAPLQDISQLGPQWKTVIPIGEHEVQGSFVSVNLNDMVKGQGGENSSSIRHLPANSTRFPLSEKIILGPKLNTTSARQLLVGTVQSCVPYSYARHTVTHYSGTGHDSNPTIEDSPYNSGIRFFAKGGDTNYLIDITSSPSGALQAYWTQGLDNAGVGGRYTSLTEITTDLCRGYTSWSTLDFGNSSYYQYYYLQEPQDLGCVRESFDVASWNSSGGSRIASGFVTAFVSQSSYYYVNQVFSAVIATLEHQSTLNSTAFINLDSRISAKTVPAACVGFTSSEAEVVAEGIIIDNGTGMTLMGMVLQGIALLTALIGFIVLLWPALPLLGEWPAQWLGLTSEADGRMVQKTLRGTTVGHNSARDGSDRLFLISSQRGPRGLKLAFSAEKGHIITGQEHE
ncbi:hypothetical protein VE00_10834 [Pseudogymnoascus sp. WSF 3629]|nr:hypothetical protein VE00_10834 [Pseudogymnoascus sp. WSF 3629]